ncbi:sensor histidine kinase [Aureimonas sp. AU40]|uniref:sensor histidine kinase n=1 Tax=Aureimonas sp. AU40 TaxID=1637747 RepID=UPI000AA39960|nr:CHASE3 domain-containing protein [Aureimonas sp. AU40]
MEAGTPAHRGIPSLPVTMVLAGVSAILLIVVASIAIWSSTMARGGVEGLRDTSLVQSSALTFLSRLQDAETGQRGYILTGNSTFLEPYERSVGQVPADLERLKSATADDPEQARQVDHLGELLNAKIQELTRTVMLVRDDRRDDALALVSAAGGKAAMDDIRLVVRHILQSEDEKQLEREAALARWTRVSTLAIAASALVALVLVAITFRVGQRQYAVSEDMRRRLAEANDRLEAEVERRTSEAEGARAEAVREKERAVSERSRVELLLQDVNHRVGNNLAMVSGMLGLQISATGDANTKMQLRAAQERVATIANAQRRLRLRDDLSTTRADEIVESALSDLRATLGPDRPVEIEAQLEPIVVDGRDAIYLAILTNEIVMNAVKHAFEGRERGRILVSLARAEEGVCLTVEDDGRGMASPAALGTGLGTKLVTRLARQFGGEPDISSRPGGGTRIALPLPHLGAPLGAGV